MEQHSTYLRQKSQGKNVSVVPILKLADQNAQAVREIAALRAIAKKINNI